MIQIQNEILGICIPFLQSHISDTIGRFWACPKRIQKVTWVLGQCRRLLWIHRFLGSAQVLGIISPIGDDPLVPAYNHGLLEPTNHSNVFGSLDRTHPIRFLIHYFSQIERSKHQLNNRKKVPVGYWLKRANCFCTFCLMISRMSVSISETLLVCSSMACKMVIMFHHVSWFSWFLNHQSACISYMLLTYHWYISREALSEI